MATNPPTQPPLTLFDVSGFEFETDCDAKAPPRPPTAGLLARSFGADDATRRLVANAEAARTRRRRARARLAKRRYLADRDGYERMEQTRRALQLVAD